MNTQDIRRGVQFFPWMLIVLLLVAAGHAAQKAPPNVLLIISDDHAWTDYGFMGHAVVRTPHIDRLAREGLCFRRGYVTSSLCCPSLASIITGRFPHQHGVTSNDPPLPAQGARAEAYRTAAFREGREHMNRLLENQPTLPRLLQQKGYLSFQAGKWWQGSFRRGGFTHGMTEGDEDHGGRHGDAGLKIGRQTLQPVYDFIATARSEGRPFLIWYAPMMPHDPHTPPERLLAKYRDQTPSLPVAKYWAMVEWFDETIGALREHLERAGVADNTVMVYLADNGWITDPRTGRFAPKSKQSPYDGGLRTPIIVHGPGQIQAMDSGQLASAVDILPTVLGICGVELPPGLPGVDLRQPAALQARKGIFGACFTHDAISLEAPDRNLRWRWGIEGSWKLILPDAVNEPAGVAELYNLTTDPFEEANLARTELDRVTRMRRSMDAWWLPN